jgi:hypothetical protein
MVRRLNYNQIKLVGINAEHVKQWSCEKMPLVIEQLEPLGWDLSKDTTWTETVFVSTVLDWYGNRIALFLTPSYTDFDLAKSVIKTKCFADFRKEFKIDVHATVLINPVIFLIPEDLDSLYVNFDFNKGYSAIDFSHFDDEDELEESYVEEWGWLQAEDSDAIEWSGYQIKQIFTNTYTESK